MVIHLTTSEFKNKVFDFDKNSEWKFEGQKPAVIDFYADWCGPCKMVAPVLESLSEEYKDRIDIYKVNTENEPVLASAFGIRSIPSLLFIPLNEKPRMATGAMGKDSFKQAFAEIFNL